jgi:2-keto-4-pentenoate hydratase/2-oxohepta-3-ene-1,7-dioic acid hydratase in catechol pathway
VYKIVSAVKRVKSVQGGEEMRLATVQLGDVESAAVIIQERAILIAEVNKYLNINHPESVFELIQPEAFRILKKWWETADPDRLLEDLSHSVDDIDFAPLYRHPRKIWGIGLNYVEHAEDLSEQAPSTEPASFMKPDTTIIGHGDTIEIPHQSERTTAEAEVGIVIGKVCKNVTEEGQRM